MRKKNRAWSRAVIWLPPQDGLGMKRLMPALRASRRRPRLPTLAWIASAAPLSERRIIGPRVAFSDPCRRRPRTPPLRR